MCNEAGRYEMPDKLQVLVEGLKWSSNELENLDQRQMNRKLRCK